jgi:hypothetical protein
VADTPAQFERDYGCTLTEWQRWLTEATAGCTVQQTAPGAATVHLQQGHLSLSWQVLEPRRIALIVLPRLAVRFAFLDVPPELRRSFLRRFDLHTQRGGG